MKITEQTVIIDGIDKVILKTLMQDARKPILAISKITGISGAAVHQRLKKLEKAEVISGSQIIINPKILGIYDIAPFTALGLPGGHNSFLSKSSCGRAFI